jgi:hypothetical protein
VRRGASGLMQRPRWGGTYMLLHDEPHVWLCIPCSPLTAAVAQTCSLHCMQCRPCSLGHMSPNVSVQCTNVDIHMAPLPQAQKEQDARAQKEQQRQDAEAQVCFHAIRISTNQHISQALSIAAKALRSVHCNG